MNGYEDAVLSNACSIKINKNIEGWIRYSAGGVDSDWVDERKIAVIRRPWCLQGRWPQRVVASDPACS